MASPTHVRTRKTLRIFLVMPLLFLLHVAEEWLGGFPAWATAHFGTTSRTFFAVSHIPLVLLAIGCGLWASHSPPGGPGIFVGIAAMATMAANGLFHAVATVYLREYSPGVVTSMAAYAPFTVLLFRRILSDRWLSGGRFAAACVLGVVVSAGIVGSLFLDVRIL